MQAAQSRPRFRSDLVAQPIDDGGQRFVDVTDPGSGKTFRFYEVEYAIACAMNGQRDLAGLASWAHVELGLEPSTDELATVINTLADLGYLAEASRSTAASAAVPQLDDLMLGQAGVNEPVEDDVLPPSADLELGAAGNIGGGSTEEVTFVAPSLALGQAGNEQTGEFTGKEQSFAGLMDDDEDHVPTTIKRPEQVAGNRDSVPSSPGIPLPAEAPEATLRPVGATPDDDDDGPTNLPPPAPPEFDDEMSVDLSDHMKLGPDAVKDAVRQSQLMTAAEPPPIELGEEPGKPSKRGSTLVPTPEQSTGADKPEPVELPDKPAAVSRPIDPVADRRGGVAAGKQSRSGLFAVLIVLVLGGALAAIYVLNLFNIRGLLGLEQATQPVTQSQKPAGEVVPAVEKKPELPLARLELGEVPAVEVKVESKGALASIVEAGTEVNEGDVVAKLKGGEAIEKKIAGYKDRESSYQSRLDAATKKLEEAQGAGNEAAVKKYQSDVDKAQKKVEEKQALVTAEEVRLEPFLLKAPAAGTVETSLGANDSVNAGDVVFSIKGEPPLKATFTVPEGESYSENAEVELISKSDKQKRLDCKVTGVEGNSVTVECPADGGLGADDEVVLAP